MSTSTPHSNPCIKFLLAIALCALLPHTAYAGAWTLQKGHFWGKITAMTQSTDKHYNGNGESAEMPADARYKTRQVYLDLFYGVNDKFDIGLQVPFISNRFVDRNESNDVATPPPALEIESGVGDLRGFAKINLVNNADLVGTLKLGFKVPIGEYREVPEALSITGGQWDIDFIAQIGRSFYPAPVYANIDFGYRLRGEYKDEDPNPDRSYTPGAEFVFNAEIGYNPMNKLLLALKYEGILGAKYDAISNPGQPETVSQSITYLAPTIAVSLNPNLSLEAATRLSVSGNQYFAGSIYMIGLSFSY